VTLSNVFNIIGVAILAYGALGSVYTFIISRSKASSGSIGDINTSRRFIVERIILSLDFFVGANIIRTVNELDFTDLGLLAGIVTIRIVLAYFLERELTERLPE
jgi:uncharacterized membrane protein